jgi:hypothetical protein
MKLMEDIVAAARRAVEKKREVLSRTIQMNSSDVTLARMMLTRRNAEEIEEVIAREVAGIVAPPEILLGNAQEIAELHESELPREIVTGNRPIAIVSPRVEVSVTEAIAIANGNVREIASDVTMASTRPTIEAATVAADRTRGSIATYRRQSMASVETSMGHRVHQVKGLGHHRGTCMLNHHRQVVSHHRKTPLVRREEASLLPLGIVMTGVEGLIFDVGRSGRHQDASY